jgi:hypothetical protein
VIAIIHEQLAERGVTVTESKKLLDQAAGTMREVDVVAEGTINGQPMILSVEVIDHARPASLTWVDQMLGKHSTMPTNKLILVSWSGFSKPALAKVVAHPTTFAMTPVPVIGPDGSPRQAEPLYVERISMAAARVIVTVRRPDGTSETVAVPKNTATYDKDGAGQEPLGEIVTAILRSEAVGRRLGIDAHHREDRENLKGFTLGFRDLDKTVQIYISFADDPAEMCLITGLEIVGKLVWEQSELKFDIVNIDGRHRGIAQAKWFGKDAVWVATPKDDETDEVQVTWRTMERASPDLESTWAAEPAPSAPPGAGSVDAPASDQ